MILVLWKNRKILKLNHRMYHDSMAGTWVVMWAPYKSSNNTDLSDWTKINLKLF